MDEQLKLQRFFQDDVPVAVAKAQKGIDGVRSSPPLVDSTSSRWAVVLRNTRISSCPPTSGLLRVLSGSRRIVRPARLPCPFPSFPTVAFLSLVP